MTRPSGSEMLSPADPRNSVAQRWLTLARARTNLVLGVAPSPRWLTAWRLPDTLAGAERFCERLLDVVPALAAVKLQAPFFERFGPAGLSLMAAFGAGSRAAGAIVIIDAKRGDAADTAAAYADLYLGPGSQLGGDGLTVLPFMGFGTLEPLCRLAAAAHCTVMVLVRTSNHAGGAQLLKRPDGRTSSAALADEVTRFNRELGAGIGPVAALVGAPADEAKSLLARLPNALVSMPGLGRPGRTVAEFAETVGDAAARVLLPVTSGVLAPGSDALPDTVAEWQRQLREHGLAPAP